MVDGELAAAASGVFSWAATWRSPASGTARCGSPAGASGETPRTGTPRSGCCAGRSELGVDFIDTADSYGPHVSEELIREALHPYDGVTIATKGGLTRSGPDQWGTVGRPEYLRQCVEMSLRRLGLDTIDLYQLHRIDPQIPAADQVGELGTLRKEGKIRHIGLSEVSVPEIGEARLTAPIASVQNLYNVLDRRSEDGAGLLRAGGARLHPVLPDRVGPASPAPAGRWRSWARQAGVTGVQLALAWLLRRSPVMLPIPGTGSVAHLEENVGAAEVELTDDQFAALSALADPNLARPRPGRHGVGRLSAWAAGQPICLPADIRSWQASTTRAVIDSSAALPQVRGS